MKRITTLAAVLATGAIAASPALADDHARDAHARDAAGQTGGPIEDAVPYRETPEKIQRGQPTWPAHPRSLPRPAAAVPADDGGSDDSVWLLLGGLVATGIAGASAAGMARRYRLRARRVAV